MNHKGEGSDTGYQRLQESKSLQEILAVATDFERTARDFYGDLTARVSDRIRPLVEELAEEEQQHFNMFSSLALRLRVNRAGQANVPSPSRSST